MPDVRAGIPRAGTDWLDIRDSETGKLLMRFNPRHNIVELRSRGRVYVVVLTNFMRPSEETTDARKSS